MKKIGYLILIIQCIIFTGCFNKNLEMSISETILNETEVDTVFPIPMAISFKYNLDAKLEYVDIQCYKLSDEKEWIEYTGGTLSANFPEGIISISTDNLSNQLSVSIQCGDSKFSFIKDKNLENSNQEVYIINDYNVNQKVTYGKEIPILSQVISSKEDAKAYDLSSSLNDFAEIDGDIYLVTVTFLDTPNNI